MSNVGGGDSTVVALLRACVEKGGTTGVLDLEEMETRHQPSLARMCWVQGEPEDLICEMERWRAQEIERDGEMCPKLQVYIYISLSKE